PKIEQSRPGRVPVLAPDLEQRDAMVNFGASPQPSAALSAAPTLEAPQKCDLVTWRIPELPCDHASTMPDRVFVGTAAPQVNLPAEAINGSTEDGAKSRAHCVRAFTVWRGRRAERKGQAARAVAQPPTPVLGRLAASRECSRQAIGSD